MLAWLAKTVAACWHPVERYTHGSSSMTDRNDALLWYRDLGQHAFGEFSIAVVQANALLEDQSQIETGPYGTFIGVYDGHGGPEAARYVNEHLFKNFQKIVRDQQGVMSIDVLRKAFLATEEGFLNHVAGLWDVKPQTAGVGTCCLVGVLWGGMLYVANVGDSRAVIGTSRSRSSHAEVGAGQLSVEHNASSEAIRHELKSMHPDDPQIVMLKHGVWRVKGIIQVSRSIGDFYLKKQEYNREPLNPRLRLSEPLRRPVLTAEPSVNVHVVQSMDRFLIFASDGLWEHLSNQEAVDIVQNHPRSGIARRLIKAALQEAARKREMRYSDLKKIDRGIRRHFHDDITVVVIFLDHDLISRGASISPMSIRGGVDTLEAVGSTERVASRM
ncbi:hypothetical protein SELMODRAFT_427794 [Selaginella moellendorffii]|uniref:protein-serine/threonine phosphatase n=1 Tax=Selaginella moellendorffii TaxID=88036 RepID=D8T0Q6_SELML|nr:probable protein phosphatase 2C 46 [Selaginella moellendorffii]EFJ09787.1 hypothetical protein SELMODRAFT_427794 [Selaginella moellendorffii]|eukprot:XP_002989193.1 probable protein phosphatase 2C 46 [Selaginella moellendorffii]